MEVIVILSAIGGSLILAGVAGYKKKSKKAKAEENKFRVLPPYKDGRTLNEIYKKDYIRSLQELEERFRQGNIDKIDTSVQIIHYKKNNDVVRILPSNPLCLTKTYHKVGDNTCLCAEKDCLICMHYHKRLHKNREFYESLKSLKPYKRTYFNILVKGETSPKILSVNDDLKKIIFEELVKGKDVTSIADGYDLNIKANRNTGAPNCKDSYAPDYKGSYFSDKSTPLCDKLIDAKMILAKVQPLAEMKFEAIPTKEKVQEWLEKAGLTDRPRPPQLTARYLHAGEVVLPNDVHWVNNQWKPVKSAPYILKVGYSKHATYRKDVCSIPAQFRLLSGGEVICKGDMRRENRGWTHLSPGTVQNYGHGFKTTEGIVIRDKNKLPLPTGYVRYLERGEVVTLKDKVQFRQEKWVRSAACCILQDHGIIATQRHEVFKIPDGYRILKFGEPTLESDYECIISSSPGKTYAWIHAIGNKSCTFISFNSDLLNGLVIRKVDEEAVDLVVERNRKKASPDIETIDTAAMKAMKKEIRAWANSINNESKEKIPVLPEGYRFLEIGELISKTDYYCNKALPSNSSDISNWMKTINNQPVAQDAGNLRYITKRKDVCKLPENSRLLKTDEQALPGDLIFEKGNWKILTNQYTYKDPDCLEGIVARKRTNKDILPSDCFLGYRYVENEEVVLKGDLQYDPWSGDWTGKIEKTQIHRPDKDGKFFPKITNRKNKCKIPAGYELLEEGCKLLDGDLEWMSNFERWEPYKLSAANEYNNHSGIKTEGLVIRKKPSPDDPPKDFRLIKHGEIVVKEDMYYSPLQKAWLPTTMSPFVYDKLTEAKYATKRPYECMLPTGYRIKKHGEELLGTDKVCMEINYPSKHAYWKLPSEGKSYVEPQGLMGLTIEETGEGLPGCRHLNLNEVIMPGDFIFDGQAWVKNKLDRPILATSFGCNRTERPYTCYLPKGYRLLEVGEIILKTDKFGYPMPRHCEWVYEHTYTDMTYGSPRRIVEVGIRKKEEISKDVIVKEGELPKDEIKEIYPDDPRVSLMIGGGIPSALGIPKNIQVEIKAGTPTPKNIFVNQEPTSFDGGMSKDKPLPTGFRYVEDGEIVGPGDLSLIKGEWTEITTFNKYLEKYQPLHATSRKEPCFLPLGVYFVSNGDVLRQEDRIFTGEIWIKPDGINSIYTMPQSGMVGLAVRKFMICTKQKEVHIPQEYRTIEYDEVVMPDDLAASNNASWVKVKDCLGINTPFKLVNQYVINDERYITKRKRTCKIPCDYRLLIDGEKIVANDLICFINEYGNYEWKKAAEGFIYKQPPSLTGMVARKEPRFPRYPRNLSDEMPKDYRMIELGEFVFPGDLVMTDNDEYPIWVPVESKNYSLLPSMMSNPAALKRYITKRPFVKTPKGYAMLVSGEKITRDCVKLDYNKTWAQVDNYWVGDTYNLPHDFNGVIARKV